MVIYCEPTCRRMLMDYFLVKKYKIYFIMMHFILNYRSPLISLKREKKKNERVLYNLDITTIMWHYKNDPALAPNTNKHLFSSWVCGVQQGWKRAWGNQLAVVMPHVTGIPEATPLWVTIASHDEGGQLAVFSWSWPSKEWTEMCKYFSQNSAYITFAVIPVTKARPRVSPKVSSGKQDCASSGRGTTKARGKCSIYRKG